MERRDNISRERRLTHIKNKMVEQWIERINQKYSTKEDDTEHKTNCVYQDIDKREKSDYDARMAVKYGEGK